MQSQCSRAQKEHCDCRGRREEKEEYNCCHEEEFARCRCRRNGLKKKMEETGWPRVVVIRWNESMYYNLIYNICWLDKYNYLYSVFRPEEPMNSPLFLWKNDELMNKGGKNMRLDEKDIELSVFPPFLIFWYCFLNQPDDEIWWELDFFAWVINSVHGTLSLYGVIPRLSIVRKELYLDYREREKREINVKRRRERW